LDVVPLAAEDHSVGHSFSRERRQNLLPNTLGLNIQIKTYVKIPRKAQSFIEVSDMSTLEARAHPHPEIHEVQLTLIRSFHITCRICEPVEQSIMIEDEIAIERLPYVDFNNVASHASRKGERLKTILRQIPIRGTMAEQQNSILPQDSCVCDREN
jgi:hypothetical protein